MTVLCIDAGTTVVKAVRYDEPGREVAVARRPTQVRRPRPGWAEQDMDGLWEAVADAVREVARQPGPPPSVLAVTAQGDGAWLVDAGGRPTGPAVLWNDGRAAEQVRAWERDGTLAEAYPRNGSRTSTGMPNAVLAWLVAHDPARLERSETLLTCGGWIFHRLTGERAMDESDASAPFLDIRAREWSPELLDLYGLGWARRLLPELRDDGHRLAALGAAGAAATGLPPGLPVVLAPYDICSAAFGVGAVAPGQACCILGTTLSTEVVVDRVPDLRETDEPVGVTVALGGPGTWLRAFPTMAGGDVLEWAARLLGLPGVGDLLDLAARGQAAGAPVFLPYLSPGGERNPFFDPAARGSFSGLSLDLGREDVARAVVEGLTCTVRECLEATGTASASLALCGGGAASAWWAQLVADTTGVPVTRSADREVGARGAQLVALVATGVEPDLATAAARHVTTREPVGPRAAEGAAADERYAEFLRVRAALRPVWGEPGEGTG